MDAIITNELTKTYGSVTAVHGINLRVPEGVAFACIGGEGSGKTTLIRMLSGLCRPSSGECDVLGIKPYLEAKKLHTVAGTVLSSARMYDHMTLSENLRFYALLNGMDENDALDRISTLLHRLDIWEGRDETFRDLPTGAAVRASLARALIGRPKVLLIDEPVGGLDKETAEYMQDLLSEQEAREGLTVLLCTRNTEYAQQLCRQFAILDRGSMLASGDLEALRQRVGLQLRAELLLGEGETPPKGKDFLHINGKWQRNIKHEDELPGIVAQCVWADKSVFQAGIIRPTLEDIYTAFLAGGTVKAGDGYGETESEAERFSEEP